MFRRIAILTGVSWLWATATLPAAEPWPTGSVRLGGVDWKLGPPIFVEATADPDKPVELSCPAGPASHLIFLHTMEPGRAV